MTPPPHESPIPSKEWCLYDTIRLVFLEVNGQGGRTLRVNGHLFMTLLSWNSAVVNIYNLERDGLRQANLPNTHY